MLFKSYYIGIEGLQNLQKYIHNQDIFIDDCMDKNIGVYVDCIENCDITQIIRLKIFTYSKTFTQKLKDIYKIYNLIRKNNYTRIRLEINDEIEYNDYYKKSIPFFNAMITVEWSIGA